MILVIGDIPEYGLIFRMLNISVTAPYKVPYFHIIYNIRKKRCYNLNILLSAYWQHPTIGGSATYMEQLKSGLEREGHTVDILARHPTLNGYYLVNGSKFIDINKMNRPVSKIVNSYFNHHFSNLLPNYKANEVAHHCFELAATYFDLGKYDLIHTQDIYSTRLLARVKPENTPLIASIHGCIATEYLIRMKNSFPNQRLPNNKEDFGWKYTFWQEYFGVISSDKTIVATRWLKDLLMNQFHVEDKQLTIIPYALDVEQFINRMGEKSPIIAPSEKTVIVCPARLDLIKGQKILIHALAQLKQYRNDWICWIVGDGNLREELQSLTRRLKLEKNVIFLGIQKNIPAILKQANICVLPSLQEAFGYAVMEAQVAGKPVVVTDAGGLPEVVTHGQTGLISQKGNSESLFKNIRQLLENESLRNTLGLSAQKCGTEKWALKTMINKTLDIYEQAIKSKKGGNVHELEN